MASFPDTKRPRQTRVLAMTSEASSKTTKGFNFDNHTIEFAKFPKFSRLPMEIQVKIWKLALPIFKNGKRQLRVNVCLSYPGPVNLKPKIIFDMKLEVDHYKTYLGVSSACFESRKIFLKAFPDSLPCFRSGDHPGIFLKNSIIQVKEPNALEGKIYFAKEDTSIYLNEVESLRHIYDRGLVWDDAQSGSWANSIQHLVVSNSIFRNGGRLTMHVKLALPRFPKLESFTYHFSMPLISGGGDFLRFYANTLNTFIDSVKYRRPMKKLWPAGYSMPKIYCTWRSRNPDDECWMDHEGTRFRFPGVKLDTVAAVEQ